MRCPLCGYGAVEAQRCSACPITGKNCSLRRCPNCGYTFAPESSLVNFFRKLGGTLFKHRPGRDHKPPGNIFH